MSKSKLYTAYFAGTQYNANGITCGMIIVTKWKDTTESPFRRSVTERRR